MFPALLGFFGAGLRLRRIGGPGSRSQELRFREQEDRCQEPDDVERQLCHKEVLISVVLEHDSTNDGYHRCHAGQRTHNQRRAPSAFMQVEHIPDGSQGEAFPGCHSEALDHAACEEGVVIVLLGADDADDGPKRPSGGREQKLGAFAVPLGKN